LKDIVTVSYRSGCFRRLQLQAVDRKLREDEMSREEQHKAKLIVSMTRDLSPERILVNSHTNLDIAISPPSKTLPRHLILFLCTLTHTCISVTGH